MPGYCFCSDYDISGLHVGADVFKEPLYMYVLAKYIYIKTQVYDQYNFEKVFKYAKMYHSHKNIISFPLKSCIKYIREPGIYSISMFIPYGDKKHENKHRNDFKIRM